MGRRYWKYLFRTTIIEISNIKLDYNGMICKIKYNQQFKRYICSKGSIVWDDGIKRHEDYKTHRSEFTELVVWIDYYPNGNIEYESYHKDYGLHRLPKNGKPRPAIIRYNNKGNITSQKFYENGRELLN